jgi:hypothetical protein
MGCCNGFSQKCSPFGTACGALLPDATRLTDGLRMHIHIQYDPDMLERRMQILLDERRYQKVMRQAKRRGVSAGAVIREAIDEIPDDLEQRRAAVDAILAADPMPVPENPADLRTELDEAHDRFRT